MKKITLCWKVNRTDDGSLFLRLLPDDGRVVYGELELRLQENAEDWPRFRVGDEVTITIKEAEKN